jgi:hypothetical protein
MAPSAGDERANADGEAHPPDVRKERIGENVDFVRSHVARAATVQ